MFASAIFSHEYTDKSAEYTGDICSSEVSL